MHTTSLKDVKIEEIKGIEKFFNTSTRVLTEKDSSFRPAEGSLSVAEQVAHAAQSIDWFTDALTNPKGFDLNFESHWVEVKKCVSLDDARAWFKKSIAAAIATLEKMSDAELMQALPEGPVMGGAPKVAIIGGMSDHTAHHRGALTVYSRLLGRVPDMPYLE